jgi:hypothetical protein
MDSVEIVRVIVLWLRVFFRYGETLWIFKAMRRCFLKDGERIRLVHQLRYTLVRGHQDEEVMYEKGRYIRYAARPQCIPDNGCSGQ